MNLMFIHCTFSLSFQRPEMQMPLIPQFFFSFLLILILDESSAARSQPCSAPPFSYPCPPFDSDPPPFPFAAVSGCGHPGFRIHCDSPHSLISIDNFIFQLFRVSPSSLQIAFPHSLPARPFNLSAPFGPSPSSCARLSRVPGVGVTNESLSRWQRRLLLHPLLLLPACKPPFSQSHHNDSTPVDLHEYLRSGAMEVVWDEEDAYFGGCQVCRLAHGLCGFNETDPRKPFLCYPSASAELSQRGAYHKILVGICVVAVALSIVGLLVLLVAVILRYKRRGMVVEQDDLSKVFHKDALLLHHMSKPLHLDQQPHSFAYEELAISTNHFDPKRKLGDGGFGSVYLGQLPDGQLVAVKKLHRHTAGKAKSFRNEILVLSGLSHPHLVKLHGFCCDSRGLLLVYEYVPNGTLADHLHCRRHKRLGWSTRLCMALQTAEAIAYLHTAVSPPIVHRDVTAANIFVEKGLSIKVGDFGLCRLLLDGGGGGGGSGGGVWTGPQGTPGYLDPDYHRSYCLTEKSDVYSFGVVLLELISGKRAVDMSRDKREVGLADMAVAKIQVGALHEVVDPEVQGAMAAVSSVAELAFRCVAADKDDRPDMREVVAELTRISRDCT
ncbi:LEAF RUST 10 DISEASE-RESISTANCE LOCUS RECEPTOR-LIKE PROTEIN KINASE-like 1.5 isoform X1 [Amborella trichopoda]|nr:LEAF RUST 10 DISEASE-RESISTANCE LOCUS RECEPTOR-LIKE PROTEIN KINASE-like 1.5 isoform X1 [Amborella trichopoda]XP_020521930.1 LEAF RUST 10 DISEASE-RESISTANCE LOCUS RECEPTOR-LIKE PROTEIN KINASE-like 1.5 isoform X1 [Amborella trichopoda]|eukprot:XP_020521929.1 LEAF RUST 10 DISEASE-RESISTANCE LOCUS RECEPTOR-LIKE PROTEIN KINASE-like 1.5 isoform X1 [Amborella trichopoda]